jgi:hypothetical protein
MSLLSVRTRLNNILFPEVPLQLSSSCEELRRTACSCPIHDRSFMFSLVWNSNWGEPLFSIYCN